MNSSRPPGGQPPPRDEAGQPAEPASRDEQAVAQFIERFAGLLFDSGVPRMPARVFGALLAAEADRLTAAQLGEILGVSPASVSGAVRYLIQVGLASGTGEPGSRRLSYSIPADVWERLMTMNNARMTRWTSTLREGAAVLGARSAAGERVTESARYFAFVAAEMPRLLARWHEQEPPASPPPASENDR